jgi:hypothetical protein
MNSAPKEGKRVTDVCCGYSEVAQLQRVRLLADVLAGDGQ